MVKKKSKPIEQPQQEPSHDSPAGIILNYLKSKGEHFTWQQCKDKYSTEDLRQFYNEGVKIYRKGGFDQPNDRGRDSEGSSMVAGEPDL